MHHMERDMRVGCFNTVDFSGKGASIKTYIDVFSQILIGLPIFVLYEFSILVAILTSSKNEA